MTIATKYAQHIAELHERADRWDAKAAVVDSATRHANQIRDDYRHSAQACRDLAKREQAALEQLIQPA